MKLLVSVLVLFALVAVKVLGVWAAARAFGPRLFPAATPSPMKVAWARFALGLVGTAVALGIATIVTNSLAGGWSGDNRSLIGAALGFGTQLTLRLAAWAIVVRVYYDRSFANRRSVAIAVVGGAVLSYLLDVPNALLAIADLAWVFNDVRFC
ncbi:MAG: hypothetical protein U0326_14180 [Polyangiales bacterium]